jgi:hypothetical protein
MFMRTHNEFLVFKISETRYDVVYPKPSENDLTKHITRRIGKRTVNLSVDPPNWSVETEIDVAKPSGFNNPIGVYRNKMGYDFERDEILLVLGEHEGSSDRFSCTEAKLLGVKRDFSEVNVRHDDLLSLAQQGRADVDNLQTYASFHGFGGKYYGALRPDEDGKECGECAYYNGMSWEVTDVTKARYGGAQERVEAVFDAGKFIGCITEGHGMHSHFIDTTGEIKECKPPNGLFTCEPVYDSVNNKIIWIEWGSGTGATQHIHVADPDSEVGCKNFVDRTPSGIMIGDEGERLDLNKTNKANGAVFSNCDHGWFVMVMYRGGLPKGVSKMVRTPLGAYDDSKKYEFIVDSTTNRKNGLSGVCRAIDPTSKIYVSVPWTIFLFSVSNC